MRVMVLIKATTDSESGHLPPPESFRAMARFNDELTQAGILIAADGLKPTTAAKRVAFDGPARTVTDGPFANPREQVAGYWIWQVTDMDEALAWARRCPNPMPGPSEINIRPLFEMADFEHLIPPEIRRIPDRAKRWEALGAKPPLPVTTPSDPGLSLEDTVAILRALADPRRYDMVRELAAAAAPVACCNLAQAGHVSPSTLSHHLQQLEQAGLVDITRDGKFALLRLVRPRYDAFVRQLAADAPTAA